MAIKLSKKKELWEIVIPEPFALDPLLKPEELIQTMSNFEHVDEMNSFLFECIAQPIQRMVVSASEYDIDKMFNCKKGNVYYSLVHSDNQFFIVVKDGDENIMGKGEASKLGAKHTIDSAKEVFEDNMINFTERYVKGMNEIEGLICQAQTLRDDLIKNEDIKENN